MRPSVGRVRWMVRNWRSRTKKAARRRMVDRMAMRAWR
jgi:hypothetical protein